MVRQRCQPPELLISIRNELEAAIAYRGGAQLLDLKEPRYGPLGRAPAAQLHRVLSTLPPGMPLSVACGELVERPECEPFGGLPGLVRFAKAGPAGIRSVQDWQRHFVRFRDSLPTATEAVAVAYADALAAAAPDPTSILEAASELDAKGILLDTFTKLQGNLFHHMSVKRVEAFVRRARQLDLWVALAGSLDRHDLPQVVRFQPRYVAVRGAVCSGGRDAALCPQRVQQFRQQLCVVATSSCL